MPTRFNPDDTILARRVLHRGQEYGLSLVSFDGSNICIRPFERETAKTVYCPGTLRIGGTAPGDWHRKGDRPVYTEE